MDAPLLLRCIFILKLLRNPLWNWKWGPIVAICVIARTGHHQRIVRKDEARRTCFNASLIFWLGEPMREERLVRPRPHLSILLCFTPYSHAYRNHSHTPIKRVGYAIQQKASARKSQASFNSKLTQLGPSAFWRDISVCIPSLNW